MARKNKDSRTYWRDREIEHAESMLKDEQKIINQVSELYRDTAREIEKEINALLMSYAEKNELTLAGVKKLVNETDIRDYEAKAARYVREKNFSVIANQEMAIYNLKMRLSRLELIIAHINLEMTALTNGVEQIIYDRLLTVGTKEVQRQAGILGDIDVSRKDIEYIAKRQLHGDDFSNRLWKNKRMLYSELEDRLSEMITKGQNPRVAARKLRNVVEQSQHASERIMITESARVQSESQMMSIEKSGYEEYEFIATEGACSVCGPLDGKIFKVSEAMPGENIAPMHPYCKCSSAAHMSREEWDRKLRERGL